MLLLTSSRHGNSLIPTDEEFDHYWDGDNDEQNPEEDDDHEESN